jgi:hypothetical protein
LLKEKGRKRRGKFKIKDKGIKNTANLERGGKSF